MSKLIIPVAGKSSRFPNMRPKWLLTMANGDLMLEWSIKKLDLNEFEEIVIICLAEHLERFVSKQKLMEIMRVHHHNIRVIELDKATASQSETIFCGLTKGDVKGPILIKDCDNQFGISFKGQNMVAVGDLNSAGKINAGNKSYVEVDGIGEIKNIIEKYVVSNYFCAGAYGFESSDDFISTYSQISQANELYVSHIIYHLLMNNVSFKAIDVSDYIDLGTADEYKEHMTKHKTVFCDLDGVLFRNGSKFSKDGWKTSLIHDNVDTLKKLKENGELYLIITTSRPASELEYIRNSLDSEGLHPDHIITDLPHTKRYLVNDYSMTNSFPTAVAINLKRDSSDLSDYL